jgi:type II secretory pathway pseudopilin PulG
MGVQSRLTQKGETDATTARTPNPLKTHSNCADAQSRMSAFAMLARARRRLRDERAQTLVELLGVMAILLIVLVPITASFVTSLSNQASQTRREDAQANARTALERLRLDIHCAHATSLPVQQNAYGGFTLTLPENPGQCPGVVPASSGSSGVEWCTIPYPGSTIRYQLFRLNATSLAACDGTSTATYETDYITAPPAGWPTNAATSPTPTSWAGNIWPTADTCTAGSLPTIAIDLNIAIDPVNHANERYELTDRIAALNSDPC